jgi:ankyrin repeat protein
MRLILQSSLFIALTSAAAGCATFFAQPSLPLHRAAAQGDIPAIRALVDGGADVDATDVLGASALYWAARGGHPMGPHDCGGEAADRPAVIAALLDLGANPNLQDRRRRGVGRSSGWTPLFVALHHQQFRSAAVLLQRGADPNIRSDQGLSVMEMAAADGAPRDLIALIVARGFDPQRAARRQPSH